MCSPHSFRASLLILSLSRSSPFRTPPSRKAYCLSFLAMPLLPPHWPRLASPGWRFTPTDPSWEQFPCSLSTSVDLMSSPSTSTPLEDSLIPPIIFLGLLTHTALWPAPPPAGPSPPLPFFPR